MPEIEFIVKNLVSTKAGTLPILLTCPHDGTEHPVGVEERQCSKLPPDCSASQFNKDPDLFTSDITIGVAERIFAITNEWPYVVMFNSHRKYIDANREKNAVVRCQKQNYTLTSIIQGSPNLLKKFALTEYVVTDSFFYLTSMEKITRLT
jgi:N-formylglutamate amidohydrolase